MDIQFGMVCNIFPPVPIALLAMGQAARYISPGGLCAHWFLKLLCMPCALRPAHESDVAVTDGIAARHPLA